MQLYNGLSPNGVRVSIFLSETAFEVPTHTLSVPKGQTRTPDFLAINPYGQVPALVLDDGTLLTESMTICRYLESEHTNSNLFGSSPLEAAVIDMWSRRIEHKAFSAILDVFKHEVPFRKDRGQLPEFAQLRRSDLTDHLASLNNALSDGRAFITGERFTIADITGMAMLVTMHLAGYSLNLANETEQSAKCSNPHGLRYLANWSQKLMDRESWPTLPIRRPIAKQSS